MDGTPLRALVLAAALAVAAAVFAPPASALDLGMATEQTAGTAASSIEGADVVHNPTRGEHVAVWFEHYQTGQTGPGSARTRLIGQRISPSGAAIGSRIQLRDLPYAHQRPSIAFSPTTNRYMVVWQYDNRPGPSNKLVAQQFDQDLVPVGNELVVAQSTTADIYVEHAEVVHAGGARFVFAWDWTEYDDTYGPYNTLQTRAWNGTALGAVDVLEQHFTPWTRALAGGPDGALLVMDYQYWDINRYSEWTTAWRIGADGTIDDNAIGLVGAGHNPAAAWSPERGEWLVAVWDRAGEDSNGWEDHRIVVRRLSAAGEVLSTAEVAGGPLFDLEHLTFDGDDDLDVSPMPGGEWLVVWQANVQYDGGTRAAAVTASGQRTDVRSVELRDPKTATDYGAMRHPRTLAAPGAGVVTALWPEAPGLRGRALARSAPATTLLTGPPNEEHGSDRATFTFSAAPSAGATFECRRTDRDMRFAPCTSPHVETGLQERQRYVFEVRAKANGWVDATPARQRFTTGYFGAPETSLDEVWPKLTTADRARFAFSANEPNVTFRCQLDGGAVTACDSGRITYPTIGLGDHVFRVWAIDADGNPDASPEEWAWTRFALPDESARSHPAPAPSALAPASALPAPAAAAAPSRQPSATRAPAARRRTVVRCVRRRARSGGKVLRVCRRVPAARKVVRRGR